MKLDHLEQMVDYYWNQAVEAKVEYKERYVLDWMQHYCKHRGEWTIELEDEVIEEIERRRNERLA